MSKYQEIANLVAGEIRDGHFEPGERVYSTRELCERHGVSLMTAVRAYRALSDMGMIRNVKGSGAFANDVRAFDELAVEGWSDELRKVVIFQVGTDAVTGFHGDTLSGMMARAAELGLSVEYEFVERNSVSLRQVNAVVPEPGAGYAVISHSHHAHFAGGALLLSPDVRTALVDSIITGSHAVLSDNFDGINRLLDHVLQTGCRRVIYADKIKVGLGMVNAAERRFAFDLRVKNGDFEGEVIDSGDYKDLVKAFNDFGSEATFMFPQDDCALRFLKILRGQGAETLPMVTGFDNYAMKEEGLERLTTYEVDRRGLGRAAVDVLTRPFGIPDIVRVPGTLIVR